MRRAALLLVALSAVPAVMQAQLCLGQAPWSAGSLKVGGSLEIGDGYTEILGGVGFGKAQGLFFGGAAGIVSGGGTSQIVLGGGIGKELSAPITSTLELCPIANVFLTLPKDEHSSQTFTAGASVGYPATTTGSTSVILTGAFQLGIARASGHGVSNSEFGGVLDAGVGFVFNERISLVPQLRLFFFGGSDVALLVRANIAVGGN